MKAAHANSGKFVLRIPPELHQELRTLAHDLDRSLNETCIHLIQAGMKASSSTLEIQKSIPQLIHRYSPLGLLGIVVFGSVARGTDTASSDVDLLLILEPKTSITRSLYRGWEHEKIALHFVHAPEWGPEKNLSSFWMEVALDGKVLWEKAPTADSSIAKLLSRIKTEIFSGQYQRKQTHGHPYWVRKE